MIIYFMPIPIVTSIVGVSLTLAFHINYAEYQTINSLYKIEHGYATHEFIFYKNKSFNSVVSKYNSFSTEQKKEFIINSLKLNDYAENQKINTPYFREITLTNIKDYVSLIRNNQTISYWTKFKQEKIANYLYFNWTAFTTADYLGKITLLNFVDASTSGFISGTVVLSLSILGVISILVYYYFSKKNGYEKDMQELGYDIGAVSYEEKIEFKKENKMSLKDKIETIDILSKNKEVIDFQNNKSNVGFQNKVLQPKDKIQNIGSTSRINIPNNKPYNTRKIDLVNTKKINLFQKQIEKSKSKKSLFFKKDKKIKNVDKVLRNK